MAWDPAQYLKFADQRLRPAIDLLNRIDAADPGEVCDLGAGAGNVTRLLKARWPNARITGVDASRGDARKGGRGGSGDHVAAGRPGDVAAGAAVQRATAHVVGRLKPSPRYGSVESLLKRFFRALPYSPEIRTQLLLGGLTPVERSALLSPTVRAACARVDPYEELTAGVTGLPSLGPPDGLIYQHCKSYLADQNLVTVDRASMACGLEVRAPFLDWPARVP
jgi:hypothetical protein